MIDKESKFLTRHEAAKYLGVGTDTLHNWACTGRYNLKYVKVGRLAKYKLSDLDDFINKRTMEPASKGCCDICKKEKKLLVDFSIKENKMRGMLCNECKNLLIWANDSPEFLQSVLDYFKGAEIDTFRFED